MNNSFKSASLLSSVERTIKRNMLKYQVGQTMFCPLCKNVLDYRKAVSEDLLINGKLWKTAICCASCYDAQEHEKKLADVVANTNKALEAKGSDRRLSAEVTDGRKL